MAFSVQKEILWQQTADLPPKQPGSPATVETDAALTDIDAESTVEIRARLATSGDKVRSSFVVEDVTSDPAKSVVVRVTDGDRIDIDTPSS
ncbi:hypothetical protein SAMN04488691_10369 [Haloferax larsenii]|uniref:Uncharacterized protein n=1 Tax=Haloferax larsenii TaxID=302484 RepID=A0A1H7MRV7_HALLR|nr:hypothetical protein SAMN04488691_10369 [Haloferax larsenii]